MRTILLVMEETITFYLSKITLYTVQEPLHLKEITIITLMKAKEI